MASIMEEMIDKYVEEFYSESNYAKEMKVIMKVSEPSFEEWDNKDDDIYDELKYMCQT